MFLKFLRAKRLAQNKAHWSNPRNFKSTWASRAAVAAKLIPDESIVCDIGCGSLEVLRPFVPEGSYLPADMTVWHPDVEFCDLNNKVYPERSLSRANVVTLLGVIEYLTDAAATLGELAMRNKTVIFSYCSADLSKKRNKLWINEFTTSDVLMITHSAGYERVQVQKYSHAQFVFGAHPTSQP